VWVAPGAFIFAITINEVSEAGIVYQKILFVSQTEDQLITRMRKKTIASFSKTTKDSQYDRRLFIWICATFGLIGLVFPEITLV